jgi:hypothetical protein
LNAEEAGLVYWARRVGERSDDAAEIIMERASKKKGRN